MYASMFFSEVCIHASACVSENALLNTLLCMHSWRYHYFEQVAYLNASEDLHQETRQHCHSRVIKCVECPSVTAVMINNPPAFREVLDEVSEE